jgi:hypothetical protein
MWDPDTHQAVWWRRDITELDSTDAAAPLRDILHWWSHSWRGQLAHAAVVGWNGWGMLIAGPDGQGKSTTALVCRDAGFDWLADDDVLLTPPAPLPLGGRRTATAPSHVVRFGRGPAPHAHALYGADRDTTTDAGLPLCAVLLPTWTSEPVTRVESAPFAAALRALAPSTVARLPGEQLQTTQQLAEIVRNLPAYHLRLGTNLAEVPHVLASLVPNEAIAAA